MKTDQEYREMDNPMHSRLHTRWLILLTAVCVCLPLPAGPAETKPAEKSVFMAAYRQRLDTVRGQLPQITQAAEAVAKRWVEKKPVLLHFPFGGDTGNFSMELISRAGGLDNAQPNTVRVKLRSANDVIVVGPRSWEKGGEFLAKELAKAREQGWMIVVFGSKAGLPEGLPVDFLIDNGASSGSEKEAALNQVVNITSAWMWCCELTAALTRLGQRPTILKGMPLPGAQAHNKEYQRTDKLPDLYPCDTPIPAGSLAKVYLEQVERELANLEGKSMQDQIARAADIAVAHLKAGKTLWASSNTHVLDGEVFVNNLGPIKAFRGISCGANGETFTQNAKHGDLLLFFGEWTINIPWTDYLKIIRQAGADFILSWRVGVEPTEPYEGKADFYDQKVDDAQMVLEQNWPFENAAVPIPFPPGKMAPVSGVHVCLLYRMLDEKIAGKLAATPPQ
jgi:hypothetical protein